MIRCLVAVSVSSTGAQPNSELPLGDGEHNTAAYHLARNATVSMLSSRQAATGGLTGSRMQTIRKWRLSKLPARRTWRRRADVSAMVRHRLERSNQLTLRELVLLARLEPQRKRHRKVQSCMLNVVERDGVAPRLVRAGLVKSQVNFTRSACHKYR